MSATRTRLPPDEFFSEGWDKMVDGAGNPATEVIRDCAAFLEVDRSTVTRWRAWLNQLVERGRK